jgi:hypothetical protein
MTTHSASGSKTHDRKPAGNRATRTRKPQQTVSKFENPNPLTARRSFEPAYPPLLRWVSETVNTVMDVEQAALELFVEYGQTAASILQTFSWPILRRPREVEPIGRGKILAQKTPAQIAGEAIARAA